MIKPLIYLFLILLPLFATVSFMKSGVCGGWSPIKDVTDPEVVEIAKFAISEHNKQSNLSLVYDRVTEGKQQVVAGLNYGLIIAVKNGGGKKYEAIVWDKPWEDFRSLTSFKPL